MWMYLILPGFGMPVHRFTAAATVNSIPERMTFKALQAALKL